MRAQARWAYLGLLALGWPMIARPDPPGPLDLPELRRQQILGRVAEVPRAAYLPTHPAARTPLRRSHDLLHDEGPGPVEVGGSEAVHVARIRADRSGVAFWVAFDELRKGISLSIVATLEIALRDLR